VQSAIGYAIGLCIKATKHLYKASVIMGW